MVHGHETKFLRKSFVQCILQLRLQYLDVFQEHYNNYSILNKTRPNFFSRSHSIIS